MFLNLRLELALKRHLGRFQNGEVEAAVGSQLVVPLHECFWGLECEAVPVICLEPFLDFPVALGVLDSAQDGPDAVRMEKCLELRIPVDNVAGELASVVTDS